MSEFGVSFGVDVVDVGVGSSSCSMCVLVEVGGMLFVVELVVLYIVFFVFLYLIIVDLFKWRIVFCEYF